MPVKRRRSKAKHGFAGLAAHEWSVLTDAVVGRPTLKEFLLLCPDSPARRALWEEHGDEITRLWGARRPGSRPRCWWEFSAPRQPAGRYPRAWFDANLPEPRRRVAGSGRPAHEVYPAYVPEFEFGVPHLLDVKSTDPPIFESEASYLRRHNLLLAGEAERLRPADFEPVTIDKPRAVG